MAKKKGKRRVKAERGTLFKNKKGSLFQNKNKDSATKKFIDGVDDNDNIELTESGKEFFDSVEKQHIAQRMEPPILFNSLNFDEINKSINILDSEKLEIENIKYSFKTGESIWVFTKNEAFLLDMALEKSYSLKLNFDLVFIPLLHENKLYFSLDKEIKVYDLSEESWNSFMIKGTPISPLSVFEERFYIVTDYSKLTCYDSSFKEEWVFTTEKYLLNKPVYKENSLFITSTDGILYQVDAIEGELTWSFNFKSPIESSAVVFENYISVASMDGKIHFLSPEKKEEIFLLDTGFALFDTPIVVEDSVYTFNRTFLWKFSVSNDVFTYKVLNLKKPIERIYPLDNMVAIINNESTFFTLDKDLNISLIPDFKMHKKPVQHMNFALLIDENNNLYKTDIG